MFVRLAFSVIVHVDPDILINDEALAVGGVLFSQKCMRFLEKFKQRGSILFVSHDAGAVSLFAIGHCGWTGGARWAWASRGQCWVAIWNIFIRSSRQSRQEV